MVGGAGVEPAANWLKANCSTTELPTRMGLLICNRIRDFGGAKGTRTLNPLLAKQVL